MKMVAQALLKYWACFSPPVANFCLVVFFFFFLVVLGFELRAGSLLSRCSTTSGPTQNFSYFFLIVSPIFSKGGLGLQSSYLYLPCSWDYSACYHVCIVSDGTLFPWYGICRTLWLIGLVWNLDPPDLSLLHSWGDRHDRHIPLLPSYWIRWDLINFLLRLTMNCNPPNVSLPGRLDYRCEQSLSSRVLVLKPSQQT
jgi:hypothetical protein